MDKPNAVNTAHNAFFMSLLPFQTHTELRRPKYTGSADCKAVRLLRRLPRPVALRMPAFPLPVRLFRPTVELPGRGRSIGRQSIPAVLRRLLRMIPPDLWAALLLTGPPWWPLPAHRLLCYPLLPPKLRLFYRQHLLKIRLAIRELPGLFHSVPVAVVSPTRHLDLPSTIVQVNRFPVIHYPRRVDCPADAIHLVVKICLPGGLIAR